MCAEFFLQASRLCAAATAVVTDQGSVAQCIAPSRSLLIPWHIMFPLQWAVRTLLDGHQGTTLQVLRHFAKKSSRRQETYDDRLLPVVSGSRRPQRRPAAITSGDAWASILVTHARCAVLLRRLPSSAAQTWANLPSSTSWSRSVTRWWAALAWPCDGVSCPACPRLQPERTSQPPPLPPPPLLPPTPTRS